jgi:uncharacterized membrane protein YvbJ
MKKCPFCAEQIQDEAVKCRFCGEFMIDAELKQLKTTANIKWYHRTPTVIISILCFGPLALPLVWFNPRYRAASKIIWTIVIIVLTVGLCVASVEVYANFLKQIEQMGL